VVRSRVNFTLLYCTLHYFTLLYFTVLYVTGLVACSLCILVFTGLKGKVKVKQSLDRPREFQEVETHRFQDSPHMKVVILSAVGTGRPYPPRNIPGTHFC